MDEELEPKIRARAEADDLRGAATLALEGYGPEILGWLVATTRSHEVAEEVFSMLSEDLWKGLPSFRWDASMRTWLYVLARHAHARYRRSGFEKRRRPLSELSDVEAAVRSKTRPWLRTDVKDRFRALRDELSEDDRSLLVLRVDRRMAWADVTRVIGEEGEDKKAIARVRKRFSLLKERLHRRAQEEGLLDRS